jgi:hypothetical protein
MLTSTLALSLVVGTAGGSQDDPARAMLAGAACAEAARQQLASWGVEPDGSLTDAPLPEGTRAVRMPTGVLGVWVRLIVAPGGDMWLERVSAAGRESLRFGSACEPLTTREAARANPGDGFTDEVLASRLARRDAGVILVWSPHMPLSVDQYAELASVTRDMGLALVTVLDPGADADYARRVARERGLPDAALRRLDGIELAFRGMTTHAPSVQVFAEGRLVGPVLYGYRARETARLAIQGVLAGRAR